MNSGGQRLDAPMRLRPIVGRLRWHFSDAGKRLLRPDDLRLETHIERGDAEVVKHGPHRTVYRISLDGFNVFWKHCRINGLSSYLRQWIRPPKARLEFDRAQALAALGIDTVEPLGWAKTRFRRSGPSHLITRELVGSVPLQSYLLTRSDGPDRRQAACELGRYMARLHEAGVAHPDLHPGNILVIADPDSQARFYLLDIHNVGVSGRPLSFRASVANMVVLNRWFTMRCERGDRCRFLEAYAESRRLARDEARRMARAVEDGTFHSNLRFWSDRASRCLETNRYFDRVHSTHARGHAVKDIGKDDLRRFLEDLDRPFHEPGVKVLKDSPTSTVAEITIAGPHGPRTMIYKRFRLKKRFASLMNQIRLSPALRSWQMGHTLLDRGLSTPRPWLVLHRRGFCGPREGYLLCDKIAADGDVHQFLARLARSAKWNAIADLGRLLNRFHDAGLSHRDLKAANLLARETAELRPHFDFIDLVGIRVAHRVKDAVRQRNLSRLNVSFLQDPHFTRTDRLRFLRAYLCWALRGRAGWKSWWIAIASASQAKLMRNRKSGRPVT